MRATTTTRRTRRRHRLPGRPPADGIVLRTRDVSVQLGARPILRSVDVEVGRGEVVALVGPNGAGKSTLLAVLAGDLVPGSGQVDLDGSDIRTWSPTELAMRRAVLLQQLTMSFPFTVRQTVAMGRTPWSGTEAEADDEVRVTEAMAATDVAHLADRTFTSLSGGERARAGLARVVAQDAAVLLLDEPTAALDVRHQEQVLALSGDLSRSGASVVVVMHDLGLAAAHADRVVVLADGRVRANGTPVDVLTPELLSDVYHHPIEVLRHPRSGGLVVVPIRGVGSEDAVPRPAAPPTLPVTDRPDGS